MGSLRGDDQQHSLEDLGISRSRDDPDQLCILISPDERFEASKVKLVFDPKTRKWDLPTSVGFTIKDEPSEKIKTFGSSGPHKRINDLSPTASWTKALPKTDQVNIFLNEVDWSKTTLGPLHTWSSTLQAYANIVFSDPAAAVVYWGDELRAVYNSEMTRLMTDRLQKSSNFLGVPFNTIWPELVPQFKPLFEDMAATGIGIETLEVALFPLNDGKPEETFWSGTILPIIDGGVIQGYYNRAHEVTRVVVAERRSHTLNELVARPSMVGDAIYQYVIQSLSTEPRDFPASFIYSASENVVSGTCQLQLRGGHGVPLDGSHKMLPRSLDLFEGTTGYVPFFRRAKAQNKPIILHEYSESTFEALIAGFKWSGYDEPVHSVAVIPIASSDRLLGILVTGLNARRPVDNDYEAFLHTLMRTLSTVMSGAIDREEAQARADRLSKQLNESEKAIRDLAEYGPVGMGRVTKTGKVLWANQQFYQISGHSRRAEDQYELSFLSLVHDDDQEVAKGLWTKWIDDQQAANAPYRLKRTWSPPPHPDLPNDTEEPVWVLVAGYPIMDGTDAKAIAVSFTDISRFKWAEKIQTKSAANAKEAKRLQENFIDIVSHEMRNPLSAITQLSDVISNSYDEFEAGTGSREEARQILRSNVENAETILLCASHQKRIIDDVLTLSKLDSMMLSITPVVVQPFKIVQSVLRMFEGEFAMNQIHVESIQDESYTKNRIRWVALDPSRLTQIFINLITNAIKFTKLESKREIKIIVGASSTRPPTLAGVSWFPTDKKYNDLTRGAEWGDGQPMFMCFEVSDTGRGLEQHEMTKLFGRFQQATEKTHIKYGGSGLGLFISRELTETQGGEIGVKSERGRGTTFAFYLKGRRAESPSDPERFLESELPGERTARERTQTLKLQHHDSLSSDGSPSRNDLCVLLVEDNVVNAKVLSRQLEKQHCDVHLATHGMEALDLLQKSRAWAGTQGESRAVDFDVLLTDIEMPIMDGLTLMRRIRQLEKEGTLTTRTNIVAVTASARQEQTNTILQAGADDILAKPFRAKECIEKMREVVRKAGQGIKIPSDDKGRAGVPEGDREKRAGVS